MHESAIARNILKIVETKLSAQSQHPSAGVLQAVHVAIGEFRNVDPQSLEFAFDSLKTGTDCRACRLQIEIQTALARCASSNHSYRPSLENGFRCTECGAGIGCMERGEELEIRGYTYTSQAEEQSSYA